MGPGRGPIAAGHQVRHMYQYVDKGRLQAGPERNVTCRTIPSSRCRECPNAPAIRGLCAEPGRQYHRRDRSDPARRRRRGRHRGEPRAEGHKMATVEIAEGEPIRKFGQIIGFAKIRSAPASIRPRAQLLRPRFRAGLSFRRSRAAGARAARRAAAHIQGLPPRRTARSARATTSAS